jgi:S1-C subfamily serine protease
MARTLALALALSLPIGFAHGDGPPAAAIDTAGRATVLIKVERMYHSEEFSTYGSGFFVHRDGYILTNWHVTAQQIEFRHRGREREVSTAITDLTVVVDSGTPQEKRVPAQVISSDRERDLALLKIPHRSTVWLEIDGAAEVRLTDQCWVVGFPFGDFLAADLWSDADDDSNPEVTVNPGHVTSLRHEASGALGLIQTDAAVNPGNSGGPMLDSEGRTVGVVVAKIQGGQGIGFAIAPRVVSRFLDTRAFRVTFDPTVVHPSLEQIRVSVVPLLAEVAGSGGSVLLEGDDLEPVHARFEAAADRFDAVLELGSRKPGVAPSESYLAKVTVHDRTTGAPIVRHFRLRSLANAPGLTSDRDPSSMMADRRDLANRIRIEDVARTRSGGAGSLADVAAKLDLKTSADGTVVLDNSAVERLGKKKITSAAYAELPTEELKEAALLFDTATRDYCQWADNPMPTGSSDDQRPPRSFWQYRSQVFEKAWQDWSRETRRDAMAELQRVASGARQKLARGGAVRCTDGHWKTAAGDRDCRLPQSSDCK